MYTHTHTLYEGAPQESCVQIYKIFKIYENIKIGQKVIEKKLTWQKKTISGNVVEQTMHMEEKNAHGKKNLHGRKDFLQGRKKMS